MVEPGLVIVIPVYNEARRLPRTLPEVRDFVRSQAEPCGVLFVDDGSRDGSPGLLRAFITLQQAAQPRHRFHLLRIPHAGKGAAVQAGMLAAADWGGGATGVRLMCDADLSTPLTELPRLMKHLKPRGACDVVIASREMPDSRLDPPQPWHRRLMARLFRRLRRGLVLPNLRDTQCGFKLFTAEAAAKLFPRLQEHGFVFDVELLTLADAMGMTIGEVGVAWHNDRDSRVRPVRDALGMFWKLLRIRQRVREDLTQT